jgi:glutamine synthetase type III
METKKLQISKIQKVNAAIDLIKDNTDLDSKISYRLGRIGDSAESVLNRLQKAQTKLINEYNKQRLALIGKTKQEDLEQEVIDKITELSNKLNEDVNNLKDEEDEINVVELKLSDFVAKEDIKKFVEVTDGDKTKTETKIIKKDSNLVSIEFFKLMGDLIAE